MQLVHRGLQRDEGRADDDVDALADVLVSRVRQPTAELGRLERPLNIFQLPATIIGLRDGGHAG